MAMAKRYTSTGKWADAWFCSLTDPEKLFWLYLLDNCDHAGIWQVNWALVGFHIEGDIDKSKFKERVVELTPERWFIPKFVIYQYGGFDKLNPANRVHKAVIDLLTLNNAWDKMGGTETSVSPAGGSDKGVSAAVSVAPAVALIHTARPLASPYQGSQEQEKAQAQVQYQSSEGRSGGEPFDYSRQSASAHRVVIPPRPAPIPLTQDQLDRIDARKLEAIGQNVAMSLSKAKEKTK